MLNPSPLSTAIVLSPGVWQYVMEANGGSPLSGLSSQRLSFLLRSTLSLASAGFNGVAVDLELDADLPVGSLQHVQVNKMDPPGEPAFLLIHLPSEATVGP
ncbi:hypothetical protein RAM80_31655 (plasmid) [Pseudomonas sp. App30]|uniref:hypothetical protein n=1 Tax=Pseudomonas sp. App30 TaxID=3068990 RepID=UPI003A7FF3CE